MKLHDLRAPHGAWHRRKRVARGSGTGHGKTAGRGSKGQMSRSGASHRTGFEGGQMPLQRRLPKRGFTHVTKKDYLLLNVGGLAKFGATVTPELLREKGLLRRKHTGVKLLAAGELTAKVAVTVNKASAAAVKKVEAAGGKVTVV